MVEVVLGHVQVCRFTTYGEPILNRISKKFTIRVRVFLPDANLKTKLSLDNFNPNTTVYNN